MSVPVQRPYQVGEVLQNPGQFLDSEIELEDLMVAQGNDQQMQDSCWMLSEAWLDASPHPDEDVLNKSHAIQLCLPSLSYAFIWTVTPCGGWPIDAYSVARVRGTLVKGTDGFAFNLVHLMAVVVGAQDVLSKVADFKRK